MAIERVTIITNNYPSKRFIESGAFVERLARVWIGEGVETNVVATTSWMQHLRNLKNRPLEQASIAGHRVLYPTYLSVSNKSIAGFDFDRFSRNRLLRAAERGSATLPRPDLFYGQFLLKGGVAALRAGKRFQKPAFADIGESVLIDSLTAETRKLATETVRQLSGLACVSRQLMEEVIDLGAHPDRVTWFPNTVDLNRFKPMNRVEARRKLGLPEKGPLALFVGHYIERKGPLRVLSALKQLHHRGVKGIFIGRGEQKPKGEEVLFAGPVPNHELPLWLNSADFFVLPTLHEGHCNAINEAMACGLPVITSSIPEVAPQVPDGTGLLVDPISVEQIRLAMEELIHNPGKAEAMGRAAHSYQLEMSRKSRGLHILNWMNDLLSADLSLKS